MNNVVIADTSCLIALSNAELLEVLKHLYQEITITKEVQAEFGEPLPEWISVKEVNNKKLQAKVERHLDSGEASSIALATETKHSILIIDETKGRKIANSYDLNIIGTLGILLLADKKGIIDDFISTILKIVNQGFRLSDTLIDKLIEEYRK